MFRRRMMMQGSEGGFPSNLQKLEWIKNTSNAYIDTEVLAGSGLDIEIKIEDTEEAIYLNTIIGAKNSIKGNVGRLVLQKNSSQYLFGYNNSQKYGAYTNEPNPIIFKSKSNIASVQQGSNNIDLNVKEDTFLGKQPLYLFAYNMGGKPNNNNYGTTFRMYYCKISKDGTEVRNFIPCKDINTQDIGMYDLVEGKFYKSASGTNFIGG